MAEVILPPDIIPSEEVIELVDDGSELFAPQFGRSASQVQQSYEPRLRVVQRFRALRQSDRARIKAALIAASGQYNTIRARVGRVVRGSFPVTELLSNNSFSNSTTGWEGYQATPTTSIAVNDNVLRVKRILQNGSTGMGFNPVTGISLSQGSPYLARGMGLQGRGDYGSNIVLGTTKGSSSNGGLTTSNGYGLIQIAVTPSATATYYTFFGHSTVSGSIMGDYIDCPYISLSRCALVDNGQNLLLQSDVLGTTWAPTRASVTSNSIASPDGSVTADTLNEDGSAATTHYILQSVTVPSAAVDYAYTHSIKAGTRTWVRVGMSEASSGHEVYVFVNLSTGAVGTIATTGANFVNPRAYVVDQGNGWFAITIVGAKVSSSTAVVPTIAIAEADNDITFSGLSAASLYAWRGTLAQSSVPTRQIQTTTTAVTGTAQTGGTLHLKGLVPVSTAGLLCMDDIVEVNGELLQLIAALDSNAAGLGYLQFKPSMFRSPSDGDPVIIAAVIPKMKMVGNAKWANEFGLYSDVEIVMEQYYE